MTKPEPAEIDESHGFIHALCQGCESPDVWLTCNTCGKSDRFTRTDEGVRCHCGAAYDHATCTCGEPVPLEHLAWVPFEKGPASLAEWEWDPRRIALIVGTLIVAAALVYWLI